MQQNHYLRMHCTYTPLLEKVVRLLRWVFLTEQYTYSGMGNLKQIVVLL